MEEPLGTLDEQRKRIEGQALSMGMMTASYQQDQDLLNDLQYQVFQDRFMCQGAINVLLDIAVKALDHLNISHPGIRDRTVEKTGLQIQEQLAGLRPWL